LLTLYLPSNPGIAFQTSSAFTISDILNLSFKVYLLRRPIWLEPFGRRYFLSCLWFYQAHYEETDFSIVAVPAVAGVWGESFDGDGN